MLKFLGIGSCFNFDMGNTSAYYIDNKEKTMLLFDCGETVFSELGKKGLLSDLEKATVIITHLHSDHVGSLPSLIFYFHYVLPHLNLKVFHLNQLLLIYTLYYSTCASLSFYL